MVRIALGQFEGIDTQGVIQRVIAACQSQLEGHRPQVGMVLASIHFDHPLMLELIHGAFPGMEVIGCTTAGDFSTAYGFSDDAISLMAIASDEIEISTGVGHLLSADPGSAVREAVAAARAKIHDPPLLCITLPEGYDIQFEPVLELLGAALGPDCAIFGGASGTLWSEKNDNLQFYGREVLTDALPILLMAGPLKYAFSIAHSWRPLGKKARVSEAHERRVRTIDGVPAVQFYHHYLGRHEDPAKEFLLAVYEEGRDEYYIRAPMDYHGDGSITFSEPIAQGAQVQLTEAIREDLIADTIATSRTMAQAPREWVPAVALVFSCAFRKEILGTAAETELQILKKNSPPQLPIMGFYSFGEIAPLRPGGKSRAHGATLVTLWIGPESGRPCRPAASPAPRSQQPVADDPQHENRFLRRKLQRSEAYRQRLESIKDLNSRMHSKIMAEIDEARRKLQQKEAALRKSEEKFRRIVQTTGEGFILMDEALTLVDANDAYCRLTGYPRAEIIGKPYLDLVSEEFRQLWIASHDVLMAREQCKFEGSLLARNGRQVPVLVHGNALRNDQGEVIGCMAFISDMTEHKKALALAGEVQRSLLPQEFPRVAGLDIAGRSVSCDEVGGDYYDFFWRQDLSRNGLGVAVGDIAGHGVDAALLMSSARAFLRLHATRNESIAQIVDAMNQHLADDVMESGRFMTLFYLAIDPDLKRIEWVRAGHDPAILYNPRTDQFEQLKGPGMALGIDSGFRYQRNRKTALQEGQVIAVATDGIWEARNAKGEMFGLERLKAMLREKAHLPAAGILDAIFGGLETHCRGKKSEDDATLVIVKFHKQPVS